MARRLPVRPAGGFVAGPASAIFRNIGRRLVPKPERGFHHACADLQSERGFIVFAGAERFPVGESTEAISLIYMGRLLLAAAAS